MQDKRTSGNRRKRYRKRKKKKSAGVMLCLLFCALVIGWVYYMTMQESMGRLNFPQDIAEGETAKGENSVTVDTVDGSIQATDAAEGTETIDNKPAESEINQAESAESETKAESSQSESAAPTKSQDASELAGKLLDDMTLEERICQMFVVTQDQLTGVSPVTRSGDTTKAAIEKYPVGGIVYFAANLVDREQCISMISNIQDYSRLGLFIAVDEEGGIVSRLGKNPAMGITAFSDMKVIGDTGDTSKAYHVGYTIGTEIAELGFNLDFAPVADVYSNPDNTVIGTRAFSEDAQTAASMVAACVQGFQDSGMLCSLKHFPGHGDTAADSHYGEAEIMKTLEELYECELIPFQAGIEAGAPFVMIGHLTLPQVIEEKVPASLSYDIVTGLLREELGFDGVIITDSMSMQAITDQYSSGEAAVKAIQAGVDIVLMPYSLEDAVSGVKAAVQSGQLTEERINESVLRILTLKIQSGIITE